MNRREKIVIKLVIFLIQFIGKPVENFYGYQLNDIIKEVEKSDD